MIRLVVHTDEPLIAASLPGVVAKGRALALLEICDRFPLLLETLARRQPDVVLVSVTGDLDGAVLAALQRSAPAARIVLWVNSISPEMGHRALELRVRGILRKSLPIDTFLECIRKVYEGELWFEPSLTSSFLSGRSIALTHREGQLVVLLARGYKNKEIAAELSISEASVKVYLSRLFEKVGAKDRFELALFGLKNLETSVPVEGRTPSLRSIFIPELAKKPPVAMRAGYLFGPAAPACAPF